jgi:protein TonB
MEKKKSDTKDLHQKTLMFRMVGFTLSLLLVISAFEWKSPQGEQIDLTVAQQPFEALIDIPITKFKTPQPPPPPVVIREVKEDLAKDQQKVEIEIEWGPTPPVEFIPPPEPPTILEEKIWEGVVEEEPAPEGGYAALYRQLNQSLEYPAAARRMGVSGKVYVEFVVEKDGSLSQIKVVRGIGAGCDQAAIRALQESSKWKPGKQRGRPVKVRMVIPIYFQLKN